MNIYLDNILIQYPGPNLRKPNFTLRKKDEEGFKAFSFTGDLIFVGADYYYLKSKLVDDPLALENEVELKFIDECCGGLISPFLFNIRADSVKWCDNECSITAAAIEKSEEEAALRCLRNTLIADDTVGNLGPGLQFKNQQHPRFTYCNEIRPQWQHDFIIICGILFEFTSVTFWPIIMMLIFSIVPIINTINFINNNFGTNINLGPLNAVTNNSTTVQDFIDLYKKNKNDLLDFIIGCGKKHPSPLVRQYAQNVCGKCSLTFSSSIFNAPSSDYYNACYHNAPVDKGVPKNDTTTFWIENNVPIKNGIQFFDQLKNTFNAEWKVNNGVLSFERRDFFTPQTPWIDVTQMSINEYTLCYSWSSRPRPSYGVFEYSKDSINSIGAEANRRWGDIVEWNNPVRVGQKGEMHPLIEFAACRFRDDGVRMIDGPERDVLSFYENGALVPAAISNRISSFKNVILLNQHMCYTPMIIIWDGRSFDDARVDPVQFGNFANNSKASIGEYYNYPMWFDAQLSGNMYTNFWHIEDPRTTGFQGKEYELTVELSCSRLQVMDLDGMVKTNEGIGKVSEIIIDYATNTMKIKGEI